MVLSIHKSVRLKLCSSAITFNFFFFRRSRIDRFAKILSSDHFYKSCNYIVTQRNYACCDHRKSCYAKLLTVMVIFCNCSSSSSAQANLTYGDWVASCCWSGLATAAAEDLQDIFRAVELIDFNWDDVTDFHDTMKTTPLDQLSLGEYQCSTVYVLIVDYSSVEKRWSRYLHNASVLFYKKHKKIFSFSLSFILYILLVG